MPSKSIFRQPGAKHFQLVHRSQRDPLIHDPEASKHVLRPFIRENAKKGKSRADLEAMLPSSELNQENSHNVGEAALYGIYYDDTEYDYMQHLRAVGAQDGFESILIEAPSSSKTNSKKSKGIDMRDLPQEAFPSASELPKTYESQQAIPESIAGFQPDMDPHLRQTLEALEDDAFVDDDLEDDFFGQLVADGERGSDEDVEFEFDDNGTEELQGEIDQDDGGVEWEERFKHFLQARQKNSISQSDEGSEGCDTVGMLPAISVVGGKRRRKGTSDASGYSMSSSSMYRNEALQTLDERFDQMVLKEYKEDDDDKTSPSSDEGSGSDEAPDLIASREDFESMMDEFLNDYEILGRKMKERLAGDTGADKLDTMRRALGRDERILITASDDDDNLLMPLDVDDKKDRWDCETILSTYSNLENHPRIIRAYERKAVARILLDPKTGFPTVADHPEKGQRKPWTVEDESDTDSAPLQTITRPRDESKEDKKARKAAVKADRQARRIDKKTMKEQFGKEMKAQMRTIGNKEKKMKKL